MKPQSLCRCAAVALVPCVARVPVRAPVVLVPGRRLPARPGGAPRREREASGDRDVIPRGRQPALLQT